MRGLRSPLAGLLTSVFLLLAAPAFAQEMKEWTFLIFLNGHNNLDEYGALNINQLETVGSTKDINIVVQWASNKAEKTKRLLVQKDNDTTKVTSPNVEELPRVDMGDWKQLVEFVRWTAQHYPAKHYFVSLWNHGSGWHRGANGKPTRDISEDDFTGNAITTPQMGLAMAEAAKILGHKVEILGSDACLMAMVEVNDEVAPYVDVTVASEELEPGLGWPYDKLIERWAKAPTSSPAEITGILTEEYLKLFLPGGAGASTESEVTLSSVNLAKSGKLNAAVRSLAEQVKKLGTAEVEKVRMAAKEAFHFYHSDYVDFGDFLARLEKTGVSSLTRDVKAAGEAYREYVLSNHATETYKRATGAAFWLPKSKSVYDRYSALYKGLRFSANTGWDGALEWMLK